MLVITVLLFIQWTEFTTGGRLALMVNDQGYRIVRCEHSLRYFVFCSRSSRPRRWRILTSSLGVAVMWDFFRLRTHMGHCSSSSQVTHICGWKKPDALETHKTWTHSSLLVWYIIFILLCYLFFLTRNKIGCFIRFGLNNQPLTPYQFVLNQPQHQVPDYPQFLILCSRIFLLTKVPL